MLSVKKFLTLINSLELKEEASLNKVNLKLKTDGKKYRVTIPYKGDKQIILPKSMNDKKQIIIAVNQQTSEDGYDDPPDHLLNEKVTPEIARTPYQDLPEIYKDAIFPATIKPNIKAIKIWVKDVKLGGKTDPEILLEIYGYETDRPLDKDSKVFASLLDRLAYRISRKIWYVGRKPSQMTDGEWNEKTRYMRPPQGSYGTNDKWINFKYDYDYEYVSGVVE